MGALVGVPSVCIGWCTDQVNKIMLNRRALYLILTHTYTHPGMSHINKKLKSHFIYLTCMVNSMTWTYNNPCCAKILSESTSQACQPLFLSRNCIKSMNTLFLPSNQHNQEIYKPTENSGLCPYSRYTTQTVTSWQHEHHITNTLAYPNVPKLTAWTKNSNSTTSATRCHSTTIFCVRLVRFEATTLCTASQQMFYHLHASMNDNFILAALKDQCTCDKFCSKSKKNAQKMHATKSGFTIITQKWNSTPLTWIAYPLQTQRKWGKSGQTSRTC